MTHDSRVMCDLRSASDTPEQRLAAFRRLFDAALVGRDRSDRMVRFRFRRAGVDQHEVQNLAAQERACCPFFDIRVTAHGDQLWWETRVDRTPEAAIMLDELYRLPDRVAQGDDIVDSLIDRGLLVYESDSR